MKRYFLIALLFFFMIPPYLSYGALKGDLNNDGKIDLSDVVLALQTTAGIQKPASISNAVDASGKIGMSDAIYALQHASYLRGIDCSKAAGHDPVIAHLRFLPSSVPVGSGTNGLARIYGVVDFTDLCGDIDTFRVKSPASDLTLPIQNAGGLTQGSGLGVLDVSTAAVGSYPFDVWLTDAKGNASNKLQGTFSVVSKGLDSPGLQPGDLDGAFGVGGKVFHDNPLYPRNDETFRAVALQADGKMVLTGHTWNGERKALLLIRYHPDGTLDNSFGTNGMVTFNKKIGDDEGFGIAVQSDGKIVVAGHTYDWEGNNLNNVLILRYNSNGTPDPLFGMGGAAVFHLFGDDYGKAIALQPDGKIVVAGETGTYDDKYAFALRCNPDGTRDAGFGTNGLFAYSGPGWDTAYGVALQTDGKVLLTGSSSKAYPDVSLTDLLLLRLKTDGTLDGSFGTGGIVLYHAIQEEGHGIAIQPDGKIIVTGGIWSYSSLENMVVVLRYHTSGTLDESFGSGGIAFYSRAQPEYLYGHAVAVQSDGKIVAVGYLNSSILVLRYNGDGTADLSFSEDGAGIYSSGGNALGLGLALQPDGRILVAGSSSYHDGYSDFSGFLIRVVGR